MRLGDDIVIRESVRTGKTGAKLGFSAAGAGATSRHAATTQTATAATDLTPLPVTRASRVGVVRFVSASSS
jgi:hypothetical protein